MPDRHDDESKRSTYKLDFVEPQADLVSNEPQIESVMPIKPSRALIVATRSGTEAKDVVCEKTEPQSRACDVLVSVL